MSTQVIMPQLGESVVEGKISRWLKQVGERVAVYEPILEVETDKVTTEVTASGEGTLLKLYFNEGDVVKAGTPIALIGAAGEAVSDPAGVTPEAAPASNGAKRDGSSARISPVVARIAAEHHVDVAQISGTGDGGRVTKKDILAYVERLNSPRPVGEGARSAGTQSAGAQSTGVREEKLEPWEQPG
jgi:pyruvate/2-oxoglutarate dehydrogenase complex dihydrolipoamide acyltransferase (E2) component